MRGVNRHIVVLLFIVAVFVMTSCATIALDRTYNAFFYTEVPNTSLRINNSENHYLPASIELERSRRSLDIQVLQNDSIINETRINPEMTVGVGLGNLVSWSIPGIVVDIATGRAAFYGRYFVIDSLGEITSLRRPTDNMRKIMPPHTLRQHQQGNFNIQIALPYINFYHLNPQNETQQNPWGFLGFGLGVEYFYRNNRSLQLRSDAMMDFFFPIPAPFTPDWSVPREIVNSLNISLTDNFHINRFRLGYGLNFARNIWLLTAYAPNFWESEEKPVWIDRRRYINNMLGLALSTHYRFTNRFYFGVIYRPSFFELSRRNFLYEHSISIDFKWKIPL